MNDAAKAAERLKRWRDAETATERLAVYQQALGPGVSGTARPTNSAAESMRQMNDDHWTVLDAYLDARRDRERLAAALAPFAREADARPWITNLSDKSGMDEMNIGGSSLTNGDLRAARAAIAADAAGG